MWSFDDEENTPGQDNTEAPKGTPPEDSRDDFEERDPFSRGGDFYKSYGSGASPKPPKNNKPPRKSGILPAIIACVLIVCLTVSIVYMTGDGFSLAGIGAGKPNVTTVGSSATQQNGSTTVPQGTAPSMTTGTPTAPNSPTYVSWDAAVVKKCLNASVLITVENVGSGSGVIYTQDGYILTNYHVVSNGENKITVTLFSGDKLEARYIYGYESNDISVIKIEKNDCTFVTASPSPVTYMMPVMVIGNALGKGFNTTQGVVSAPASEVYFSSTYETMTLIRIDAAVNSGNSGGGLFNTAGELVGIVNAKLSGTSTSGATIESMGYAIPMSSVMKCVNDLNQYGYVTGIARLGVTVQNYLEVGNERINAIVIQGLTAGGSAEKSGVRAGDILYALNGESITSFEMLKKLLMAYSVGDSVTLTVLRPTAEAEKQNNPHYYLRECEEVKITLKFVEFNPNK